MKLTNLVYTLGLLTLPAHAATVVWQGGAGAHGDANWTVGGVTDQAGFDFFNNGGTDSDVTISSGSVTGFDNAAIGTFDNGDSLTITGDASISGDYFNTNTTGTPLVTLESGSMSFSSSNAFRSTSGFNGTINFTGLAGSATISQTDLTGTSNQALAGKISANSGTTSYFSIDGIMATTGGVVYDGTNLGAINTALASNSINGKYFEITEAAGVQTLNLRSSSVPEPSSTALIGLAGLGFIIRRRR
ncbi:hypothetical protein Rhal01_02921 [Rubritalea halochordaticola]|uniref:Ice-binding protein C-terminal domain-containing protein n=1 Tax=Rubritalea halochordaticola TaxID=714537 RepID=A0ABP9V229_9BACT